MKILWNGTITDIPGISASGLSAGIKQDGKKDLCVVYSKYKTNSAAVFTNNKVKAAPLLIDVENIKNDNIQAIVANSGNANSCTGEEGLRNARRMVEVTANCLNISPNEVLVASTGALSKQLPMEVVVPGIEKACSTLRDDGGADAAEAIMTTDTCRKTIAVQFAIQGRNVTMAGMTKGSTMIHPNMGTILLFIATDADISKQLLQKALKESIDDSFNMISIDGDTSTNDMAVIMANGASGNNIIVVEDEDYKEFCKSLNTLCTELAKMIVKDGEGSTKAMEVTVLNANSVDDARTAARAVVSSNLVKCELYGGAVKWSTIACILGYSGIIMNAEDFDITIGDNKTTVQVVKAAMETDYKSDMLSKILNGEYIKVLVDLKNGCSRATAFGCDLTCDYVRANGHLK